MNCCPLRTGVVGYLPGLGGELVGRIDGPGVFQQPQGPEQQSGQVVADVGSRRCHRGLRIDGGRGRHALTLIVRDLIRRNKQYRHKAGAVALRYVQHPWLGGG